MDFETLQYFTSLAGVFAAADITPGMVKNHVLSDVVSLKMKCFNGSLNYEHWEVFKNSCCDVGQAECEALVAAFESFALTMLGTVSDSEMCVASVMDAAFGPFVMYCGRNRNRNTSTHTSGTKKPDYSLRKGKSPIFNGEEKLSSNYRKGVYGHDPEKECVDKTPWERWTDFYGDTPFILAYTCLADDKNVYVEVGLLVKTTRTFFSLFAVDIAQSANRPVFARKIFNLLPVLAYIYERSKGSIMAIGMLKTGSTVLCSLQSTSIIVDDKKLTVEKKWSFHNPDDVKPFLVRMDTIKRQLATCADLYQCVKMSVYEDELSTVRGYYRPVGKPVLFSTFADLLDCIIAIAGQVKILISIGVVHNDIRWDNIVRHSTLDGIYFLIDFDDAVYITGDDKCAGLRHLGEDEHSRLIRERHGHEVDIWAIGKLLSSHRKSTEAAVIFGANTMTNCQCTDISDLINNLQHLKALV